MSAKTFENGKPLNITLGPDVRFLWPHVFEKRVNEDGEDKFEVLIQIPYKNKKAIALVEDAIDAAIFRGFSGELSEKSTFKKGTKETALKLPLKDGSDKEDAEYGDLFEGYMYLTARSARKPSVLDCNGQQILDADEFYSGVIGAVSVTVFPYNNKSQGVSIQLNHLMKLSDGERIGGGAISADDAFSEYMTGDNRGEAERRPSRSRASDDAPVHGGGTASRSRSRDDEEQRPSSRASRSRAQGDSDDPMFD